VGTSEKAVRRAVKREEVLVPSASRALDQKKITQEQADLLADMNEETQRAQLRAMVQETRKQTRGRLAVEKAVDSGDKMGTVTRMLSGVYSDCSDLKSKIDAVMRVMHDEELDYDALLKMKNFNRVGKAIDSLTGLLGILED